MTDIRVLIIAENALARAGLAALLDDEYEIAGQTGDRDLATVIETSSPDVLLYDMGWNVSARLAALDDVLAYDVPLVLLIPDEADAPDVINALTPSGAFGLLLQNSDSNLLLAALEAVSNGLTVFDPLLTPSIAPTTSATPDDPEVSLTPRENEVLQLLAQGLTNRAIAHRLQITENTIKFHVNAIMGKLNAQSRTDAVIKATRLGWVIL